MELSDRSNWILSGLVGGLLTANGVVWLLRYRDVILGLVVGGAMAVIGLLAAVNAVRAVRDPNSYDQEWTSRQTATNMVAIVVLVAALVATLVVL